MLNTNLLLSMPDSLEGTAMLVLLLAAIWLWVTTVQKIMNSSSPELNKILWVLVVLFFPIAGSLIYRAWGRD